MAPMTTMRSLPLFTPSNCTRNSVLRRRLASCSPDDLSDKMLSISSACHTWAVGEARLGLHGERPELVACGQMVQDAAVTCKPYR